MSVSSQNSVVVADNCCPKAYRLCNKVAACADFLHLKTGAPDSDVTIRIIDKHNRVYYHDVETDSMGYAVIDLSELPKALLNEFAGAFRISVIQNGTVIKFEKDGEEYDEVIFECTSFTPRQTNAYIDISL